MGLLIDIGNIKGDGLPVDGLCTAKTCNIRRAFIALFWIYSTVCNESGKLSDSSYVYAMISATCDKFN